MGAPTYATRLCASLCSNGHPAIQLKYMYSTLQLALLFGCVVYASATSMPIMGVAVAMGGTRLAWVVAIMMLLQYDPGQNHGLMKPLALVWF